MTKRNTNKPTHAETMAAKVIESLENGTAPWVKPWKAGAKPGQPQNAVTGKAYRGANSLLLSLCQPNSDPRWLTFKQAKAAGWKVKKGSKGISLQRFIFEEERAKRDESGRIVKDENGKTVKERFRLEQPKIAPFYVFHASQVEGIDAWEPDQEPAWISDERAETVIKTSGATIDHEGGDRAFYSPVNDSISLPKRHRFESASAYYGTALHELAHWTGHPDRLERDMINRFGSEDYAREELRAEIASYMMAEVMGTEHDPSQHTAYIGGWIKALKEDPQEIMRAARDAEKILEFLKVREIAAGETDQEKAA